MVELIESNTRKTDTFRVGVIENIVNSRYVPDPLLRAGHLAAVAAGVDSFWVPDHLNSLFPRSICTQKYMGAARLAPSPDAYLEPWTMLGYLAAHNRLGRLRLGVCHRYGAAQPRGHGASRGDAAAADPWTSHSGHRDRRA
jgi:hypothetical protein